MSLEADEENQERILLVPVLVGSSDTTNGNTGTNTLRSERKRQRERKRRSALSNAFDELASFVVRMDPEPGDHQDEDSNEKSSSKKKQRTKSTERENHHGISQLDIVGRTLKVLKRLHDENENHKHILNTMQSREGQHGPISERTFAPTTGQQAWNRALDHESSYPPSAYYAAYPSYHHAFSRYDYHHHGATMAYDGPDYGPPGRSSTGDDHHYWTNHDWGRHRRRHNGDHHPDPF